MSEKRRPDAVFTIKTDDVQRRYEVFRAEQFSARAGHVPFFHAEQPDLQLTPLDIANNPYVRVRVDGVWFPQGRRSLYPAGRLAALVAQDLSMQLLPRDR